MMMQRHNDDLNTVDLTTHNIINMSATLNAYGNKMQHITDNTFIGLLNIF